MTIKEKRRSEVYEITADIGITVDDLVGYASRLEKVKLLDRAEQLRSIAGDLENLKWEMINND